MNVPQIHMKRRSIPHTKMECLCFKPRWLPTVRGELVILQDQWPDVIFLEDVEVNSFHDEND